MDNEDMKQGLAELRGSMKMNDLKLQALMNILAKEGLISKADVEKELDSLCEKGSD
jgi:hypothetical protein